MNIFNQNKMIFLSYSPQKSIKALPKNKADFPSFKVGIITKGCYFLVLCSYLGN